MRSKRTIYLALLLVVVLAFVARQMYYAGKWCWHKDDQAGFALGYPATWFQIHFYHCSTCQQVNLFVMDVPVIYTEILRVYSAKDIDEPRWRGKSFGEWIIHQNSKHIRVLSRREVHVGLHSYPGVDILYEDDTFRGRIITLHHSRRVYAIEMMATKKKWNKANTVFDKILKTFDFLE